MTTAGYTHPDLLWTPEQLHRRLGDPNLAIIDVRATSDTLPAWWQFFNVGTCRGLALSASSDFTLAPSGSCADVFQGQAQGGATVHEIFPL